MKRFLRALGRGFGLLVLILGALWVFGPREPMDATVTFQADRLGRDLDGYLATSEAQFDDITPGTEKRVMWAGAAGAQTDVAFVYLHGWGASSEEIRPVPDRVAAAFGANLYFARLKGHGRAANAFALAEPSMNDWVQDTAEAIAIGKRLGKRVVLLTTSTGGTLGVMAAASEQLRDDIDGLVLISPNFGPANPQARLANWPLARYWVPLLVGEWREWEPLNDQQAQYWTTRSQAVAVMPMMALIKYVDGLDLGSIGTPALFLYSEKDRVVSPELTNDAIARWGGEKDVSLRQMTDADDPKSHVIAGDIMSPNQTEETVELIVKWVATVLAQ